MAAAVGGGRDAGREDGGFGHDVMDEDAGFDGLFLNLLREGNGCCMVVGKL